VNEARSFHALPDMVAVAMTDTELAAVEGGLYVTGNDGLHSPSDHFHAASATSTSALSNGTALANFLRGTLTVKVQGSR
jgi:hypothetical protein